MGVADLSLSYLLFMSYCVIPGCLVPQNSERDRSCRSCNSKLLLRERYRALRPIGQGGFGKTFLAIDEDLPSKPFRVIKQLYLHNPSSWSYGKAIEQFHQEAVRLDELGKHPQIPSLFAHFEQNRLFYLIQEFIDGQTLAEELEIQGAFTEPQIWEVLRDLLDVVKFIHAGQVIHRDIKPSNIIRRRHDHKLVLIDFGIAKQIVEGNSLLTGTVTGSPEYMAPEQNRGKAIPASDLYSLGIICIRLLTNVSPFDLFDINQDCWIWRDRVPASRRISRPLCQIIDKLLQNAVNQRYQTAEDVLQALTQTTQPEGSLLKMSSAPRQPLPEPVLAVASPAPSVKRDYRELQGSLVGGNWRQADEITWAAVRQLLGKTPDSYLFPSEIDRLPWADLKIIDQLWVKHSRGRFGFSVQVNLYRSLGEDYGSFCDRVGWPKDNGRDRQAIWQFTTTAPIGHLPSRRGLGGQNWWRHLAVMAGKFAQCEPPE